ncbi:hypothetical protein [Sinosporangium siamense]|uniref:hypothetical protein n=1 Tax=Sinosporangium siamense TaxID=1367973 RepID=UPI00194F0889|nr:hypothetical protein [Sinosporangium siamense]
MIRELEREKITFGTSRAEGSFLEMPDTLNASQGLLDASLAAGAAFKFNAGDGKALALLEKYADRVNDPDFTKVFLQRLGAKGITQLPAAMAARLRQALNEGDTKTKEHLSPQSKRALTMLSKALAAGTDPKNKSYMGDDFLRDLARQGRAEHSAGPTKYAGYQAQALIWRAHDGKPPFSEKFMQVVGADAVAYEKEEYKGRWDASKDPLGQVFNGRQVPLYNLAGALGLGTLMRPGAIATRPGAPVRSSVIADLLHAAGSSKDATRALLSFTPPGWKETVLTHMLTTRLGAFEYAGERGPFSDLLTTGLTGQDQISRNLASDLTKAVADQIRGAVGRDENGNLRITNRAVFERLEHLGRPLGMALAANIDQLSRLLHLRDTFGKVDATDMSYALVLATRDDVAYDALIRAQTEHMKAALNGVPPVGLDKSNLKEFGFTMADLKKFDFDEDGRVDRTDVKQFLIDNAVAEARPFSHIVEIRRQSLIAAGLDHKTASEEVRIMVRDTIGLLPVPYADRVGTAFDNVFGKLVVNGYEKLAGVGYDEIAKQVAKQTAAHNLSLDQAYRTLADDRTGVERIMEQTIGTAMLMKGMLEDDALKDAGFLIGDPPQMKPFAAMSPAEYKSFLELARNNVGSRDLFDRFSNTYRRTSDVNDLLDLRISQPGGGK